MALLHQWNKAFHVGCVLFYIHDCNVFITDSCLEVIGRKQHRNPLKNISSVPGTGFFPYPGIAVRIRLYFGTIDIGMFQINMVFLKNIGIDIQKNLFDGIREFLPDEAAKGGKGRHPHAIEKIQVPNIVFAEFFDITRRRNPLFHESKEYHFEEFVFITSWTAHFVSFHYKIF